MIHLTENLESREAGKLECSQEAKEDQKGSDMEVVGERDPLPSRINRSTIRALLEKIAQEPQSSTKGKKKLIPSYKVTKYFDGKHYGVKLYSLFINEQIIHYSEPPWGATRLTQAAAAFDWERNSMEPPDVVQDIELELWTRQFVQRQTLIRYLYTHAMTRIEFARIAISKRCRGHFYLSAEERLEFIDIVAAAVNATYHIHYYMLLYHDSTRYDPRAWSKLLVLESEQSNSKLIVFLTDQMQKIAQMASVFLEIKQRWLRSARKKVPSDPVQILKELHRLYTPPWLKSSKTRAPPIGCEYFSTKQYVLHLCNAAYPGLLPQSSSRVMIHSKIDHFDLANRATILRPAEDWDPQESSYSNQLSSGILSHSLYIGLENIQVHREIAEDEMNPDWCKVDKARVPILREIVNFKPSFSDHCTRRLLGCLEPPALRGKAAKVLQKTSPKITAGHGIYSSFLNHTFHFEVNKRGELRGFPKTSQGRFLLLPSLLYGVDDLQAAKYLLPQFLQQSYMWEVKDNPHLRLRARFLARGQGWLQENEDALIQPIKPGPPPIPLEIQLGDRTEYHVEGSQLVFMEPSKEDTSHVDVLVRMAQSIQYLRDMEATRTTEEDAEVQLIIDHMRFTHDEKLALEGIMQHAEENKAKRNGEWENLMGGIKLDLIEDERNRKREAWNQQHGGTAATFPFIDLVTPSGGATPLVVPVSARTLLTDHAGLIMVHDILARAIESSKQGTGAPELDEETDNYIPEVLERRMQSRHHSVIIHGQKAVPLPKGNQFPDRIVHMEYSHPPWTEAELMEFAQKDVPLAKALAATCATHAITEARKMLDRSQQLLDFMEEEMANLHIHDASDNCAANFRRLFICLDHFKRYQKLLLPEGKVKTDEQKVDLMLTSWEHEDTVAAQSGDFDSTTIIFPESVMSLANIPTTSAVQRKGKGKGKKSAAAHPPDEEESASSTCSRSSEAEERSLSPRDIEQHQMLPAISRVVPADTITLENYNLLCTKNEQRPAPGVVPSILAYAACPNKSQAGYANKKPCRILFDGGASHSYITRSLAKKCRIPIVTKPYDVHMVGFSGNINQRRCQLAKVTLINALTGYKDTAVVNVIDKICGDVAPNYHTEADLPERFLMTSTELFPNGGGPVDILLGNDFYGRFNICSASGETDMRGWTLYTSLLGSAIAGRRLEPPEQHQALASNVTYTSGAKPSSTSCQQKGQDMEVGYHSPTLQRENKPDSPPGRVIKHGATNLRRSAQSHAIKKSKNLNERPKNSDQTLTYSNQHDSAKDLDEDLWTELKSFWECEAFGIRYDLPPPMAAEERATQEHFERTLRYSKGQFQVRLPFKDKFPKPANNYQEALDRFKSLERLLLRDPRKLKSYEKAIQDYIDAGHVEPVHDAQPSDSSSFYLPHHCVEVADSQSHKVRIVFDGSSHDNRLLSLNHALNAGVKLQTNLPHVLMQFRKGEYALISDLKQMFLQIEVHPEDRCYIRFLWKKPGTPGLPRIWTFRVLPFGLTASPYLAIAVVHKTLAMCTEEEQMVASRLKESMYIDDILLTANSREEAMKYYHQVTSIMHRGHFVVSKWLSNDPVIMKALPEKDRALGAPIVLAEKPLMVTPDAVPSVLGLVWEPLTDSFEFKGVAELSYLFEPRKETMRTLCSRVAKIYDPLGYANPFVLRGKLLIQECWKQKLAWDTYLSESILKEWLLWVGDIFHLSHIRVPRNVKLLGAIDVQLHGFSDASSRALACGVYLRVEHEGFTAISLIMAKSRLATTKPTTIPRLELTAAHMLARLTREVASQYDVLPCRIQLWSDSSTVLHWIKKGQPDQWKMFIRNRLSEIQELFPTGHWNFVPTKENIADVGSRGCSAFDLAFNKQWLQGPDFLHKSKEHWPNIDWERTKTIDETNDVKHERLPTKAFVLPSFAEAIELEDTDIYPRIFLNQRHFHYNIRILAILKRFVHNVKAKLLRKDPIFVEDGSPDSAIYYHHDVHGNAPDAEGRRRIHLILSREELQDSFLQFVHGMQRITLPEEFEAVKEGTKLKATIKEDMVANRTELRNLPLVFDSTRNIMRVASRLRYEPTMPAEIRFPPLLPTSDNEMVTKYIVYQHRTYYHAGTATLLSHIGLKCRLLGSRSAVNKAIRHCPCFKTNPKIQPYEQIMAALPPGRDCLTPWLVMGLDIAGPLLISNSDLVHSLPKTIKTVRPMAKKKHLTRGRPKTEYDVHKIPIQLLRKETSKVWVMVYTCLSTRAVSFQCIRRIHTTAVINSLHRHIAAHSKPSTIFSDNGRSFLGANQELKKIYERVNWPTVALNFDQGDDAIEWKFQTPFSPHMGGSFERIVQSCKRALFSLTSGELVDYDTFITMLAQAEACVNSRPLASTTAHTLGHPVPITPAHLILGRPLLNIPYVQDTPDLNLTLDKAYSARLKAHTRFRKQWMREYFTTLHLPDKWKDEKDPPQLNELILIKDDLIPRRNWPLGIITELVRSSSDGLIRTVGFKRLRPDPTVDLRDVATEHRHIRYLMRLEQYHRRLDQAYQARHPLPPATGTVAAEPQQLTEEEER